MSAKKTKPPTKTKPQRSPRTSTLIRETLAWMRITDRCEEFGTDCWIWTGATSHSGHPIVKMPGQPCTTVRRVVMKMDRRPLQPRQPCATTCGDKLCCNPAHLQASSTKAIGQEAAKRGAWNRADRIAKITATRRAQSKKMSTELAAQIRASAQRSIELATLHGLSRSMVNKVRAGMYWRDTSSPFAGLGARR